MISTVIAAPTSAKLTEIEIQKLIDVNWQTHMLAIEAAQVNEYFRMTFTVADEPNCSIVKGNHERAVDGYRKRAGFLLDYVRSAISELRKKK